MAYDAWKTRSDLDDAPQGEPEEEHGPECAYCGTSEGLRLYRSGMWGVPPEFVCEHCFTPTDTGPCFDDLPEVK